MMVYQKDLYMKPNILGLKPSTDNLLSIPHSHWLRYTRGKQQECVRVQDEAVPAQPQGGREGGGRRIWIQQVRFWFEGTSNR